MDTTTTNLLINIAILIGIGTMFYYQNSRIRALKTTIDSQKEILNSAQQFISIFDLDKIQKYVIMNEDTVRKETEEKVKQAESKIAKLVDTQKMFIDNSVNRIVRWYGATFGILLSIKPDDRDIVIDRISDEEIRNQMKKIMLKYKDQYNPPTPLPSLLSQLLFPQSKGLLDIVKKPSTDENEK